MPASLHKEYFERIAPFRARDRKRHRYYWEDITNYCNYFIHEEHAVLEIGCGTGELIHGICAKRKVGVDYAEGMIQVAKSQFGDVDFHVMDAMHLTLDEKFDVIILSNVAGVLDDIQAVLQSLKKVCHSRTKIIISYYSYLWEPVMKLGEWTGLKRNIPEQAWLSQKDIINLLYLAGFETYRSTQRMLLPVYIPLVSYFFNHVLARLPLISHLCVNHFAFARPMPATDDNYREHYSVSVVIPARNESGNIEDAVMRLPKTGKHTEIIFVEGNSTDDTWEKIQQVQQKYKDTHDIKIARQEGKGKGDAVRKGFSIASGDILMILDADLTVPPEDIPKFYDAIASGKGEFINGSRLVYPMEKQAMRFLNLLGNKFFSMVFTWLLERPFKDTLCGTKVIFRDDYRRLIANRKFFGDFDPFGDFDLLFGAYKLNLKIIEVPVRYKDRTYGETNISRFKHGMLLLRMCMFAARKIKFY